MAAAFEMKPTLLRSDMHYWVLKPDTRLSSQVLCYFVTRATDAPMPPATSRSDYALLLPDGYSELVLNFRSPYERWSIEDEKRRTTMQRSYLIGGRSHSVLTRALGKLEIVGAKLDPRALRMLIGVPLSEFRDSTLSLADLNHRPLLELEDAVANAKSVPEIARILDRFFLKALADRQARQPSIDRLVRRVRQQRGALSIMQWMQEERIDPRNFERRFCAWMGMTPKRYARVVRFKHSYMRWLSRASSTGRPKFHLEDYYDQSHFSRDFKYFTGIGPRERAHKIIREDTDITDHLLREELGREGIRK